MHIFPFAAFLLLLQAGHWLKIDNSELPWWRSAPEQWIYPLQCLVCLLMLWIWRRHYDFRPVRGLGVAAVAGLIGISVWLLPVEWHARTGLGGDENHWLHWLGFRARTDGFNPTLFDPSSNPVGWLAAIGFRFLRLVVIVPLVEEIFWRGFLMRWLIDTARPWPDTPVGTFEWKSFTITTLLFAAVHWGPDFGVALVFGALAGWVTVRTGSLTAAIVMHATANLILGVYVMQTGFYGLW